MKCCVKLEYFRMANVDYLLENMKKARNIYIQEQKELFNSMFTSRGTFHFDGREVCSYFNPEALRLTLSMQSNIRKVRTTNYGYVTNYNLVP